MGTKTHRGAARAKQHNLVIFDYGKTLIDPGPTLVPGAKEVLDYLASRQYWLRLVSIIGTGTADERFATLEQFGIRRYFDELVMRPDTTKFKMLYQLSDKIPAEKIVVIDDRAANGRALHWGYLHGTTTIWLRRGEYANELPPPERPPTYTIQSLQELMAIL